MNDALQLIGLFIAIGCLFKIIIYKQVDINEKKYKKWLERQCTCNGFYVHNERTNRISGGASNCPIHN